MTQKQISGILKQNTIQVSYDKWSEEVQNNIKEVEKICRQNPRKDIMQLKRQRKKSRFCKNLKQKIKPISVIPIFTLKKYHANKYTILCFNCIMRI